MGDFCVLLFFFLWFIIVFAFEMCFSAFPLMVVSWPLLIVSATLLDMMEWCIKSITSVTKANLRRCGGKPRGTLDAVRQMTVVDTNGLGLSFMGRLLAGCCSMKEAVALKTQDLNASCESVVVDMERRLVSMSELSACLAERNFDGQRRSFQKFLQRTETQSGWSSHVDLLPPFRLPLC